MSITFTKTDKALIDRTARYLNQSSATLLKQWGENWAASKQSRAAKAEYDRLQRDERDLRHLAVKWKGWAEQAKDRAAAVVPPSQKVASVEVISYSQGVHLAGLGGGGNSFGEGGNG